MQTGGVTDRQRQAERQTGRQAGSQMEGNRKTGIHVVLHSSDGIRGGCTGREKQRERETGRWMGLTSVCHQALFPGSRVLFAHRVRQSIARHWYSMQEGCSVVAAYANR